MHIQQRKGTRMQLASIADDRLETVEAIAEFLGVDLRRCRHLIHLGLLPVGREGRVIVASKQRLMDHWREVTRGDTQAA
jgi:hypothetical protein